MDRRQQEEIERNHRMEEETRQRMQREHEQLLQENRERQREYEEHKRTLSPEEMEREHPADPELGLRPGERFVAPEGSASTYRPRAVAATHRNYSGEKHVGERRLCRSEPFSSAINPTL